MLFPSICSRSYRRYGGSVPLYIVALILASFLSWPSGAWALPDGRVYEKVTPTENEGSEVYVPLAVETGILGTGQGVTTRLSFTASLDGSKMQYIGDPISGGAGNGAGGGAGLGEKFLASRFPEGGWSNLGYAPEEKPLFAVTPPNRSPESFHAQIVGENSGHTFFEANDALTANAIDGGATENNLYESVNGKLILLNVLPNGSTEPNATFGAPPFGEPAENPFDFSAVISNDGSRVLWTLLDAEGHPKKLFADEGVGTGNERTVQVDASQDHGPGGDGRFWTASSNGSDVFFTDSDAAGLTASTILGSGENLYEYDVPSGVLTDLTPDREADVEGVLGAGEDGNDVYLVATGAFKGSGENSEHESAIPGRDNLYVFA